MKATLDHVHVYVKDRYQSAKWFEKLLGFKVLKEYEFWAENEGPLSLSSDGGFTKIALFTAFGKKPNTKYALAFKLSKSDFYIFLEKAYSMKVKDYKDELLSEKKIVDHRLALSVYFKDPDGNHYEVTCYEI